MLALWKALPINDARWAILQELFPARMAQNAVWELHNPIVQARFPNLENILSVPLAEFILTSNPTQMKDWLDEISALAQEDFWESVQHYAEISSAWARDFARDILKVAMQIDKNPFIGQETTPNARR